MAFDGSTIGPAIWQAGFKFTPRLVAPRGKPRTTGRDRQPVNDTARPVQCAKCGRSTSTLVRKGDKYEHASHRR